MGWDDFAGDYGKSFISIAWKDEGLSEGLRKGNARIDKELSSILNFYAPQIENWMKDNAPWTDQTGSARNGLAARAYFNNDGKGIVLFHQVPYGIWLEVRFSGKFGIIDPALQEWGPRVMEATRNMLRRI